jgi:hypothetical protein
MSKIFTALYLAFVCSALLSISAASTFGIAPTQAATTTAAVGGGVTVNLADFGASGDGFSDDSPALQRALDHLAQLGGGTLLVPAGHYALRTPVARDFSGLADSLHILGVESSTPVDTSYTPDVLTRGLDLTSRFFPQTGSAVVTLRLSGLRDLTLKDLAFEGTPGVFNDALVTLDFDRIAQATVRHCEFYGLRTDSEGGAIVSARRSRLRVVQTMFLGTFGYSALYVPVIQNLEWLDIDISTTIFADYGQHPGFHGKTQGATFSWVTVGNPAAVSPDSPRREAVIRDVIMDEGAMFGIFAQPARYQSPSPPIDLLYVTELFQNVSNLGTAGNLIYEARDVLIEDSHYGYSHYTNAAIDLRGIGTAIVERAECVAAADKIRADAATDALYVVNSIYDEVISQARLTRLLQGVADADDPVRDVRRQFQERLGRAPAPSEHAYWAGRLLRCIDGQPPSAQAAACVAQERAALAAHLSATPAPTFALTGTVTDEEGAGLPDATVTLTTAAHTVVTRTDAAGGYRFTGLATSGDYRVTASKGHYLMEPATRFVRTATGDRVEDFTATLRRYAIRGRVVTTNNYGFAGVPVTLSGGESASVTTDAEGFYSFAGLRALGSYTVTPTLTNHTFEPGAQTVGALTGDAAVNFYGRLSQYRIAGRVADGRNRPLAGATVTLSGAQAATTTTDAEGNYSFTHVGASGNYTVTVRAGGYTFAPATRAFNNLSGNETGAHFTVLYGLSGRVTTGGASNAGMSGVTLTLSGAQTATTTTGTTTTTTATTTTDANGNYSFAGLMAGANYTVTATLAHHTFTPGSASFANLAANQVSNFTGALNTHTLSGRVTEGASNAALSGVTVHLTGGRTASAVTDAGGNYAFAQLPAGGSYAVTAVRAHYTFTPATQAVEQLSGDRTAHFTATLNRHTIGGRVTDGAGAAVGGVTVTLGGAQAAGTTTDASGHYSFANLPAGGRYTVTATKTGYALTPPARTVESLAGERAEHFTATLEKYEVWGRVVNVNNYGLGGVTVGLSGGRSATVVTNAEGYYSFGELEALGGYTVRPELKYHTVEPGAQIIGTLTGRQGGSFVARRNTHSIGGRITDSVGAALSGVTVTLSGAQAVTTTAMTDAAGNYSFANLPAGDTYTVTPTRAHYTFNPASLIFDSLNTNQTGNFNGTLNTHNLSGRITDGANNALSGVTITLSGTQSKIATTDTNGNYLITGLNGGGNYTVTPSRANYTFTPPSQSLSNLSGDRTTNFTATLNTFSIGGRINAAANANLSGVTITLAGSQSATTTTDAAGNYSFAGVAAGGNYTVTPSLAHHTFNPSSLAFNNLGANQTANFSATRNTHSIGGQIKDGNNVALGGVSVTLSGGQAATTVTDANGNYSFANLPAGADYTVAPAKQNYTFAPAGVSFSNLSANQAANFAASLNSYAISGRVMDGSNPLANVTLSLTGARTSSVVSDANGNYTFSNLTAGNTYTVTPSLANYTFAPSSRTFDNLSADQKADFGGALKLYNLGGRITVGTDGLAGVTITLSGSRSGTTTTDANGSYTFADLPAGGNYVVTPTRSNYAFNPGSLPFNNLSANQTANFAATLNSYTLGGRIGNAAQTALAGVTVTLTGSQNATTTTDASGNYSFNVAAGGNYTVTPSLAHHTFLPASLSFTNLSGDRTGADFSGALNRYFIGGRVADTAGAALSGVSLELRGDQSATTTTDAGGNYSFPGLPAGGNYTVTGSKQDFTFTPPLRAFASLSGDQPRADFTAEATPRLVQFRQANYEVSEGSARATLIVTRTGDTSEAASVEYVFQESAAGVPCTAVDGTANARCDYHSATNVVAFAPGEAAAEIVVQLIDDGHVEGGETLRLRLLNATGATLGAQSATALVIQDNDTAAGQNPIFTTPFFVRMQYLDFLSREPEAGEPWSAILDGCPDVNNNPACDRMLVSQSFFGSPEFRLKGFYAFNFYRVAFGRRPTYEEIIPNMRSLTGATAEETYRKRAAFPVSFTESVEFKDLYGALSDVAFVNALLDRHELQRITTPDPANPEGGVKVTLTRADLVGRLGATGAGSLTRAQALRAVVESDEVAAAEYNRAFVAMQYYGYLRRSPEEDGYQAWLKVITRDPNNIRLMVDGFMNSTEYRLRFGSPKADASVNTVTGR